MTKVCVVGHGFMGGTHAGIYHSLPEAELAAVVDFQEEVRAQAARKYGCRVYESLAPVLADDTIEVVDVCLPTPNHRESVVKALEAGKNVLCEKPISLSLEDADAILEAAKNAPGKFMVAHVIRLWPEYAVTKQLLDKGDLGAPLAANASRFVPAPDWSWDDWLLDPDRSGGAVIDNHIHDLDYLNWVFGRPETVYARGLWSDQGGLDHVFTTLEYPGGKVAVAESGFFVPAGMGLVMTLKLQCEEGLVMLSNIADPTLTVYRPNQDPVHPELPAGDGYVAEIKYFLECVAAGREPEVLSPEDARLALETSRAALDSARNKTEVKL